MASRRQRKNRSTRKIATRGGSWLFPTPGEKVTIAKAALNKALKGADRMAILKAQNAYDSATKNLGIPAEPKAPSVFSGMNPMRGISLPSTSGLPSPSRFSMPAMPKFSYTPKPSVDPSLKTSTGLFKSVIEGKNWARATPNPKENAKNTEKFMFAEEPETSDDRYWSGKPGVSEKRVEMGLPGVYYNQEFQEYNTKPPIWTNFKNASGKWIEPKNVPRITTKGRFYGKTPPDVLNTLKAFKNSYLSKQKNDYTRRYNTKMAKAKSEWAKIAADQKKDIEKTLSLMTKEYKDYLGTLQKDVEAAYSQQMRDLQMTKRLELQEAADKFKVEHGFNPGTLTITGNTKKELKLMNAMKAAAAAAKGAALSAPLPPSGTPSAGTGLGDLLGFAKGAATPPTTPVATPTATPKPEEEKPAEEAEKPAEASLEEVVLEAAANASVPPANGAAPPAAPSGGRRTKKHKYRSRK